MSQIPWGLALAVFMGTLPLLGVMVWNLVGVKALRAEINQFRSEVRAELTNIRERLAALEERDRPLIRRW